MNFQLEKKTKTLFFSTQQYSTIGSRLFNGSFQYKWMGKTLCLSVTSCGLDKVAAKKQTRKWDQLIERYM